MTTGAFRIRKADYQNDLALLRDVRERVFVQEQHVPIELEWDELDQNCDHVLAIDAQGQAIGTGRLTPEHTIGRMAVLEQWRGKGVGDALLLNLIALARSKQLASISLHAQVNAIGFYQKHGFSAYGPTYLEAGIMHQSMTLSLT